MEYAWSGYPIVEIDDLDADDWHGVPFGVFLASGNAPEVWFVGVVLLEGPRAGELATADLVVRRSDAGELVSVEFVGRTAFGPHPDPPRLAAARRRFDQLQRGLDPFGDS